MRNVGATPERNLGPTVRLLTPGREILVLGAALLVLIACAVGLDRFATLGNVLALLRSVSVVGILALGMMVAILGRGIDLSQVAVALVATGATVKLVLLGLPVPAALVLGGALALGMGLVNGILVSGLAIPALLATLASGMLFIGLARVTFLPGASIHLPPGADGLARLGGTWSTPWVGVPVPPLLLAGLALAAHLFLRRTVPGRFLQALGDNPRTAWAIGLPVGRLVRLQYLVSAGTAFAAGLVMLASSGLVDLQAANSTLIFDVLLVAVLGGASLSGGRGSVAGVLAATLLVGLVLNAMTILDVGAQLQGLVKGGALLAVIVVDGLLNRDEAVSNAI